MSHSHAPCATYIHTYIHTHTLEKIYYGRKFRDMQTEWYTLSLPISARDRFISVAQRIQETEGRKGPSRPWEYLGYSDIDPLEFPEFSPGQLRVN